MKNHLIQGIAAGVLASIAGIAFLNLYYAAYFVDYSLVVSPGAIIGSSVIGGVLISTGYFILEKLKKENLQGILNIVIMIFCFLSVIPVMAMKLPLEVEFPELFPGLVIPMHFFPAMAYFGLSPFFNKKKEA